MHLVDSILVHIILYEPTSSSSFLPVVLLFDQI
jgi:hypothetical protein